MASFTTWPSYGERSLLGGPQRRYRWYPRAIIKRRIGGSQRQFRWLPKRQIFTGGEQATDTDQLRAAPELFGPVASDATISRFMRRIKEQPEAFAYGFATMTRNLRTKVWAAAGPRNAAQ